MPSPFKLMTMRRRARRARRARRRCLPAATTSCTSLLCHGNLSLLSSHPQQWPMATLHLSFLSPSSAPALPSLEMSPAILVASSTSKMESMPLHLSPSEPACLVPNCPSSCSTMLLYLLYSGIFVLVHCDFHPTKLTVPKST